jgi:hypothetical protein
MTCQENINKGILQNFIITSTVINSPFIIKNDTNLYLLFKITIKSNVTES